MVIAVQLALASSFARSGEVGWGMYAFAGLLWAMLVGGLARGARLAWLWGRHLTLILGAMMVFTVLLALIRSGLQASVMAIALLGLALPLFVAGLALGRPAAYRFFDLVCPACDTRTGTSADFLFRRARCRKCQNVW